MLTAANEISRKFLAEKVIETARNQVYFALRYLEPALFRLQPLEKEDTTTGSDGKYYYYNAEYLCRRYLQNPVEVEYDYLHTVLHCLFCHPMRIRLFDENQQPKSVRNDKINEETYWDLAADIVATDVILEMALPQFQHLIPQQCRDVMDQIRSEVPFMDIPQIARYLKEHETQLVRKSGLKLHEIAVLFYRDDHSFWQKGSTKADLNQRTAGDSGTEESWKEIATVITQNAGTLMHHNKGITQNTVNNKNQPGIKPPSVMLRMLRRMTRDTYDYTEFLRKFARLEECMKLDEDAFDYVYYVYGFSYSDIQKGTGDSDIGNYHGVKNHIHDLNNCSKCDDFDNGNDYTGRKRYGTIPDMSNRILACKKIALLEPLEYREDYRIRDFVIAIDTSASCSGRLVQQFLNKTYHILKSMESFSDRVVVHILQCDCAIREDIRIESLRQFEEYLSQMRIRGMGGTDFRPVFAHVDQLCAKQKIRHPGGLIYFTDGRGIYPQKPPAYRTAFVFVGSEDETNIPSVPPWAMKLHFEENS